MARIDFGLMYCNYDGNETRGNPKSAWEYKEVQSFNFTFFVFVCPDHVYFLQVYSAYWFVRRDAVWNRTFFFNDFSITTKIIGTVTKFDHRGSF